MAKIVYDPTKVRTASSSPTGESRFNVFIREGRAPRNVTVVSPRGEHIGSARLTKRHEKEYGERGKGFFEYLIELFK